jgi:hypothetical protein
VSQAESASPSFPPLPVRLPTKPSRAPWVILGVIVVFCLLTFGGALALYLWSRERFESKDLFKATSIEITYHVKSPLTKTVVVNDPAAVKRMIDALSIISMQPGAQVALASPTYVVLHLPDGKQARLTFVSQTQLDRANWGMLYVSPAFYQKVNEEASRIEGKPIDIMRPVN